MATVSLSAPSTARRAWSGRSCSCRRSRRAVPVEPVGPLKDWLVPRDMFDAARYEGSDAEERRLFYVALTRARDWVSLSSHSKVTKNAAKASPYITGSAGARRERWPPDRRGAPWHRDCPTWR